MAGKLYLVATPIGNLKDITLRAIETLRAADIIACEDTRHTGKLLKALEIADKRLVSYHEHNEAERAAELIRELGEGRDIAVVSDAGTPAINDPGFRLVEAAVAAGYDVVPIPGACAFVSAVVASGLATDAIHFAGFLPSRQGERRQRLQELRDIDATLVVYESPHRVVRSLADCIAVLGDRRAAVGREITKLHEEFVRGTLSEIARHFEAEAPRGEFVLVIDRSREATAVSTSNLAERVAELEHEGKDRRAAMKQAAKELGLTRSEAYRQLNITRD